MKLLALVRDPAEIERFLAAVGLSTTAPALAPARAAPYWQSRVLRRKAQAQDRQLVLDVTTYRSRCGSAWKNTAAHDMYHARVNPGHEPDSFAWGRRGANWCDARVEEFVARLESRV